METIKCDTKHSNNEFTQHVPDRIHSIKGIFSTDECNLLIQTAEKAGFNPSPPSGGGHGQTPRTGARTSQFYVKDDDKWSKDANNEKIDETIYNIKMKQTSKLTDWEKLHPNYAQDPKLLNEWQQILNSMTEDIGQRDKVKDKLKRNLAEHVQLKQALTDSNNQKI